jgi:spore germination protein D
MKTIQESMQTPLFRMEVLNLLKKVVQEELEPKEKKDKGSEGGESGNKQQSSGGGSGDDSGS